MWWSMGAFIAGKLTGGGDMEGRATVYPSPSVPVNTETKHAQCDPLITSQRSSNKDVS